MINFTIGPVQMDKETLEIGKEQIPYFRTPEFSKLTLETEKLLCNYFDAPESSRVVYFPYGAGVISSNLKKRIYENYEKLREKTDNHFPLDTNVEVGK